jgi:hypothetical protein
MTKTIVITSDAFDSRVRAINEGTYWSARIADVYAAQAAQDLALADAIINARRVAFVKAWNADNDF